MAATLPTEKAHEQVADRETGRNHSDLQLCFYHVQLLVSGTKR